MAKINAQRHVSGKLQAEELGSQNNKAVDPNSAVTVTTSSTSYGTPFTPTSIGNCRLWLDAADTSTIISESLPSPASNNLTSSFTDVVCWLDATDSGSLTVDGSNKVSQWKDKSGNNNHFGQTTSANQPVLSASSFNGQQSVYNDGDDFLTASNFITSSANTTWFAVGQTTAESSTDWIIACDGFSYALGISNYINIYQNNGWQTKTNTPYYACWQHHNDKTFDTSINGGHGLQVPYRDHTSINNVISVGGAYNNSNFRHTGDMVEFIFFTRSLNDNERISIERYLSNKYNITPWVSSSVRHKQWTDKSGQGNHAINKGWAYTPQYTSSAGSQSFGFYPFNDASYPNTEFDRAATNFYIGTTGSVVSDETFTLFAAITPRSVGGYNFMYGSNDGNINTSIGWYGDNLVIYRGGHNPGADTLTNGVREIAVWGVNSSGSTYQIHSDGVLGGSGSYSFSDDFTDKNWILGSGRRNDHLPVEGNVHEFLVYTGSVSDADRTKIETYLQNKWGVTVATQSSDVRSDNTDPAYPTQSFFSEVQDDCSLWADFTDTTKVKTTGSDPGNEIYRVEDKSRKNNDPIQNTSSQYPHYLSTEGFGLNNLPSLSGKTGHLDISSSWTANSASTVYGVFRKYENSGEDYLLSYGEKKIRTSGSNLQWVGTGDAILQASSSLSTYKDYIVTVSEESASIGTSSIYLNGVLEQHSTAISSSNDSTLGAIAGSGSSDGNFAGNIGEIIMYDPAVTSWRNRKKVERYLADKYNINYTGFQPDQITASIDATGNSKSKLVLWLDANDTSTITQEEWSPLSIPSCSLWLDASDTSTITLSGSDITNWASKVGSISATQTGSAYRPTTGTVNGKNVILFSGSSDSTAPYLEITGSGTASFNFTPTIDSYTIFAAFQQNEGTVVDINYALFPATLYTSGNASATQVNTKHGGVASRAIDGDTDGVFANNSVTHTNATAGAWWQVDFDQSREIYKTVVYNRTDWKPDALQQYRLDFYSGSYVSGSEIYSVTSSYSGSGVGNTTPDTLIFPPVVCKAIRLTKIHDDGEYLHIAEFQAFGSSSQSAIISKGVQYALTYDKGISGLSSDHGFIESATAGNNTKGTTFHLATSVASPTLNKLYVTGTLARTGSIYRKPTHILIDADTVNFALSASGSTASQINTKHGGVASRAIDGNTDGDWSNSSVTHTSNKSGAWWQIDFGQSRTIAKTVVYNRTDWGVNYLQQYRLDFYSGSYVSGDEIQSLTSDFIAGGVGNATPDTMTFVPVTCQTIRLTKIHDDDEYLHFAEFQAFGGTELPYTESFKIGAYDLPNSASVNRILRGAIGEILVYTGSLSDADRTAVETYLQNKWNITVATQSADYYEGNAITNWSSKVDSISATQTGSAYRPTTGSINGKNVILFSGSSDSTAPYLEITGSGTASFNFTPTIDSYTIFAAFQQNEGTVVDINYALFSGSIYTSGGASASQIDNIDPIEYGGQWYSGSADLAIDGDTSQGFFDGSMAHTSASAGAWWQVDFDQSREIHKTVVYGRTDATTQDRLQQYRLDFYSGSYTSGSQIHSLTSTYSGSGVNIDTQILTSSVVCKAIRLTKIHDNAEKLSIAEFQAFGSSSQSAIISKGQQYAITYDKGFSGFSSDTGLLESTTAGNNTQGTTFHLVTNVVSPTLNKIYVTGTLARTGNNVAPSTSAITTGTVNFALSANGSTASQIDTLSHAQNPIASKAIDGNTDGNFFNGSTTHTNTAANVWWQVDFGQSRRIAKTVVYGRSDSNADRLQQYRLDFYSGSYASGSEIRSVTSDYLAGGVGNSTPDTLLFPPVDCQTIRLTKIHDNAEKLSIAEFQAFDGDYVESFKIGAYDIPNSGSINRILSGAIGEVLIYEGALTDFERKHVEEYLYDKWEIVTSASY